MFLFGISCSIIFNAHFYTFLFFFKGDSSAAASYVWLSLVLNVPILFSTIGCKISTTSFLMFIACVWDVFRLVFFLTLKLHVRLNVYMLHIFAFECCWKIHEVLKNVVLVSHFNSVCFFCSFSKRPSQVLYEKWVVKICLSFWLLFEM